MRMFPGAVCKSEDRTYLAVYNFQHDVYNLPSTDMSGLERIAHVSYSYGRKKGGIDYFQLTGDRNLSKLVRVNKNIKKETRGLTISPLAKDDRWEKFGFFPNQWLQGSNEEYDIQYELVKLSENIQQDVLDFSQVDILTFCGDKPAKEPRGTRIDIVEKISAKTKIKKITPYQYLRGGKQWFVPECVFEANIDFGQGCLSGFVPIDNSWSFDGEYFHNLFSMLSGECEYCYAEMKHKSFPKTIYRFDKQQLKEELLGGAKLVFNDETPLGRAVKILRFGKRTESWTPFTQEEFMQTLETCEETGTRCIIPTKFLPYSPEIANLLKRTNSTLLYSIGWDEVEKGACMWGANNQWRLEQALKYKEAEVNSNLYLLIIGHHPPSQRDMQVLEFAEFGRKIPIQLLPTRFRSKALFQKMAGDKFEEAASEQGVLFSEIYKRSYIRNGQSIILDNFDPFWLNLARNSKGRIRICHHNDKQVYCGRCFQGEDAQSQNREHIDFIKK